MSLEKVPAAVKKSRYRQWRERKAYGKEIKASDVKKLVKLNNILRDDGKKLGIPQLSIEIIPKKYKARAAAVSTGYKIQGDGTLNMPSSITYDYYTIDNLSLAELRSVAWHELGHYIFAYYFPEIDDKYYKDVGAYSVAETFADEFAYKRFGNVYIRAMRKLSKMDKKKAKKDEIALVDAIKETAAFRKKHNRPHWMFLAEQLDMEIKYNPRGSKIAGVNPKKSVLKGLYEEI